MPFFFEFAGRRIFHLFWLLFCCHIFSFLRGIDGKLEFFGKTIYKFLPENLSALA